MINNTEMISIAKRNMDKARRSFINNQKRKGVSDAEVKSLVSNLEYATKIYDMLCEKYGVMQK